MTARLIDLGFNCFLAFGFAILARWIGFDRDNCYLLFVAFILLFQTIDIRKDIAELKREIIKEAEDE